MVHNLVGHDAAVLVIDVQRSLFGKPTPIYRADELLTNIAVLVERARAVGALVIYVQHSSHRQLQLGSEDWQVHPKLVPRDDDLIVHKTHGNAFEETLLHGELSTRGIQRLVVTGLVTHGCVRATVQGGLQLGYEMIVASDAHSSYRKDADRIVENWNRQLHDAGAVIVPTAPLTAIRTGREDGRTAARGAAKSDALSWRAVRRTPRRPPGAHVPRMFHETTKAAPASRCSPKPERLSRWWQV